MTSFRRKSDQLLSKIPGHPDEALTMLIEMWEKVNQAKKDGFAIMAYKERLPTYVLKDIKL